MRQTYLKITNWNNNHSQVEYSEVMPIGKAKEKAKQINSLKIEEVGVNSYWYNGVQVDIKDAETGENIKTLAPVTYIKNRKP